LKGWWRSARSVQKVGRILLSYYKDDKAGVREEVTYDSGDRTTINNPFSGLMEEAFRSLLGEPYALRINPRGRIVSVKLPEKAETAWKAMPWLTDKRGLFSAVFSADEYGPMLAPVFPELPGKHPGKGGAWSYPWTGPQDQIRFRDSYAVAGAEGQVVKYVATTEITASDPKISPIMEPSPLSPRVGIGWGNEEVKFGNGKLERQAGKATLNFDPVTGHLTASTRDLAYRISADYRYREMPGEAKPGSVNVSFHLTAGITLTPQKER